MPIDNSMGGPGLPPPNSGELGPPPLDLRNSPVQGVSRPLNTIVDTNTTAANELTQAHVDFIKSDNPGIVPPSQQGRDELGRLGGSGDGKDPGGRGNLWLGPNPVVYIQTQMLKLHEALRQSGLGLAKYENTTMSMNIAFAELSAALIMKAASAEAHMAMLEAVAAGVAAGASAAALGFSGAAFGKAHFSGGDKVKTAKMDMKNAEAEVGVPSNPSTNPPTAATGKHAAAEQAQADHIASQKKLDEMKSERAALEQSAGTSPTGSDKAKMKKMDAEIRDQREVVAQKKEARDLHETNLSNAQSDFQHARSVHQGLQQNQYAMFNNITQLVTLLNTFFSQAAVAATKGLSTQDILEKGMAQAYQQVVDALRENIKQSGQAASQTQQQGKEAMSALIQAIDKFVDETTRAMTMTRN